jgi:ABC-type transporter Mla subunit MlaD
MIAVINPAGTTWTTLPKIGEVLRSLVETYVQNAWPFVLAHFALLLFIVWDSIRPIRSEIRAFRGWRPDAGAAPEAARFLDQFVREARAWAAQGVLVPMTDYSDRLDSHIDQLFDSLHGRVNLFLIIGITGTFFAMFQFAMDAAPVLSRATGATADAAGRSLANSLVQALGQAFPVGFFGLILTITGHIAAYRYESLLRAAAWQATQSAMDARLGLATGPAQAIREALKPLETLDQTLRDRLQPLIEGFKDQLESAASLIQSQVRPLTTAVDSFGRSVEELGRPVKSLADAAAQLPAALQEIATLQGQTREQFAGISGDLGALGQTLASSATELNGAAAQLTALVESLRTSFAVSLTEMHSEAVSLWKGASEQFLANIQPSLAAIDASAAALTGAASALESAPNAVREEVGSALDRMAEEAARTFAEAANGVLLHLAEQQKTLADLRTNAEAYVTQLAELREQVSAEFSQRLKDLADESTRVWRQSSEESMRSLQNDLLTRLDMLRTTVDETCEKIGRASSELQLFAQNARTILTDAQAGLLREAMNSLQPRLDELRRTIAEDYPKILQNLAIGATESSSLIATTRAAAGEMRSVNESLAGVRAQWAAVGLELTRTLRLLQSRDGMGAQTPAPCEASSLTSDLSGIRTRIEEVKRDVNDQRGFIGIKFPPRKRKG